MASTPKTIYPCFPKLERGQPTLLKTDPKRKMIIYALERTVVLKDVANPLQCQIYTQHQYPVTAVAMAPSGCYVCSGDSAGTIRIWACDNPDQILKAEFPMLGGAISDIAWNSESNRIMVVGAGQPPAKVIMWDSGNTVGDLSGHSKPVKTCDFKPTRPFRAVTGADDYKINWYEGPPFKWKATAKTHTNFVNVVRFSPDGSRFFTASSDKTIAIFDGKEGTLTQEKAVHGGSIMGACWSSDGTQILTCSPDKTCKIIDAGTLNELTSFAFGTTVGDQQMGCLWLADTILSYSLNGNLSFLDPNSPGAPAAIQYGHNRPIQALCFTDGKLFSGSFEDATNTLSGVTRCWDLATGVASAFAGKPPANRVLGLGAVSDGLAICALDNTVSFATLSPPTYTGSVLLEDACPKAMASAGGTVAIVTGPRDELYLVKQQKLQPVVKLSFSPTCVAVSPNEGMLAVGGEGEPASVFLLDGSGAQKMELKGHNMAISALAFSPDGAKLASGCANKEIIVWDAASGEKLVSGLKGFHVARISTLAWNSKGVLASGGIDSTILVWDLEAKKAAKTFKLAHTGGGVNALCWVDDATVVSGGSDACIKTWSV